MSELFGINIAQTVSDALSGQLSPITLTREVPGVYDPVTDMYAEGETLTFTSEGIAPAVSSIAGRNQMLQSGLITASEEPILIVAIPLGTEPKTGDSLTINNKTYTITGIIESDPSGSTWTVKGEL